MLNVIKSHVQKPLIQKIINSEIEEPNTRYVEEFLEKSAKNIQKNLFQEWFNEKIKSRDCGKASIKLFKAAWLIHKHLSLKHVDSELLKFFLSVLTTLSRSAEGLVAAKSKSCILSVEEDAKTFSELSASYLRYLISKIENLLFLEKYFDNEYNLIIQPNVFFCTMSKYTMVSVLDKLLSAFREALNLMTPMTAQKFNAYNAVLAVGLDEVFLDTSRVASALAIIIHGFKEFAKYSQHNQYNSKMDVTSPRQILLSFVPYFEQQVTDLIKDLDASLQKASEGMVKQNPLLKNRFNMLLTTRNSTFAILSSIFHLTTLPLTLQIMSTRSSPETVTLSSLQKPMLSKSSTDQSVLSHDNGSDEQTSPARRSPYQGSNGLENRPGQRAHRTQSGGYRKSGSLRDSRDLSDISDKERPSNRYSQTRISKYDGEKPLHRRAHGRPYSHDSTDVSEAESSPVRQRESRTRSVSCPRGNHRSPSDGTDAPFRHPCATELTPHPVVYRSFVDRDLRSRYATSNVPHASPDLRRNDAARPLQGGGLHRSKTSVSMSPPGTTAYRPSSPEMPRGTLRPQSSPYAERRDRAAVYAPRASRPTSVSQSQSSPPPPQGGSLLGKSGLDGLEVNLNEIIIDKIIGQGASSQVYKGQWRGAVVAVKHMQSHSSSNNQDANAILKEFYRELGVMLKLRHPNLVLFMGAKTKGDKLCVVTEYCDGGNLFDLLHGSRPTSRSAPAKPPVKLTWPQKFKICLDIARACQYLHTSTPTIIHRDLKSLNVLLANEVRSPSDVPISKVSDFGLSRIKAGAADSWGHLTGMAGTYYWMAPEIIMNKAYDEKVPISPRQPFFFEADVYSFAIVMYEVFTQKTPYFECGKQASPVAIAAEVAKGKRPNTRAIPADAPEELVALLQQCWHANPKVRPVFEDIAETLQKYVQAAK